LLIFLNARERKQKRAMAYRSAETTAKALRDQGPPVLKTSWHGEERLQLAPDDKHQGETDPHKTGRAIDIVLDSQRPTEKMEGEILVQAFIDLKDEMQWEYLIYAQRAWDPLKTYDQAIPRIADPRTYTTAWDRARYEHVTHIHIQWSEGKKDLDSFQDSLIQRLQKDSWADDTLEDFADQLVGVWKVRIGNWSGIFNFAIDSSMSWASNASSLKHAGRWWFTNNELLWKFSDPGDTRTFVVSLPLDSSNPVSGVIRPEGQGWFSMSKT
jgi:hypothetical protein